MLEKKVVEKINTHFMFSNLFFSEIRAVGDSGKNVVELEWPQTTM